MFGKNPEDENYETIFHYTREKFENSSHKESESFSEDKKKTTTLDPLYISIIPKGFNLDTEMLLRPDQEENIKMTHPDLYHNICESYTVSNNC